MDFLDEDDFGFEEWLQCCLEPVALPLEHLVTITGLVTLDLEVLGVLLMVNFPKIIVKNLIKGCWRQTSNNVINKRHQHRCECEYLHDQTETNVQIMDLG